MVRRWMLTLLALLALAPFLVLATHAKKGGNKPPPEPPPPADPAITYTAMDWRTGYGQVWVMNADGSNQTIVYEDFEYGPGRPSWSGDGTHIAFGKNYLGLGTDDSGLWRVDVDVVGGVPVGSNARVVVDDVDVGGTAWSPTSDVIAFTAQFPPWGDPENTSRLGRELRLVPAGGGTQEILYATEQGNYISSSIAWSPDGTRIAFREEIGGVVYVRVFDLATGAITTPLDIRSENHSGFYGLSWARTDDLLAYSESTSYVVVKGKKEYTHYRYTVRTLDLDTGEVATVPSATDDGLRGQYPAWSPDDSKLALQPSFSGVDVYDFATGLTENLVHPGNGRYPDWRR